MYKILNNLSRYHIYPDGKIYGIYRKRFLKPDPAKKGHRRVCIVNDEGQKKHYSVHRLIAEAFIPNPHMFPFVCHIDSDPKNNNTSNLRWDTATGNMKDRKNLGRYADQKGERNYSAKLSSFQVLRIRLMRELDTTGDKIALLFNISRSTVGDIESKRSWSHI